MLDQELSNFSTQSRPHPHLVLLKSSLISFIVAYSAALRLAVLTLFFFVRSCDTNLRTSSAQMLLMDTSIDLHP